MPPFLNRKNGRAKMDALLRHLGCGEDLQEFPGTKFETLALTETAGRRGLIAWREASGRYELTPIGLSKLAPRRFGLASLMVSTAIGATIGAAALAVLWLPAGASHGSVSGQSAALFSRSQDASPAVAHAPGPSAAPAHPIEPPKVAEQPAPEQPGAEADPASVKQAAVNKPRRKTAHHRRKEQTGPSWAFADWRTRQFTRGQASWLANR
jgi:hypothetical protein